MIDFHTHILHDIDDGPSTLDEALQMARIAIIDGINVIVATPHGMGSRYGERYNVVTVHERLHALRTVLNTRNWPLEIVIGSELRYHPSLPILLQNGRVLPCGNHRVVLLECPGNGIPTDLEQGIFQMQIDGYRVVLAHPERIRAVQRDPDVLIPLIERGVLMQLTGRALIGEQGATMQNLAELLLTNHMIHLIASDGHDATARRSPQLSTARRRAAELIGKEAAASLVMHHPAALISGKALHIAQPQSVRKRQRWFWQHL